MVGEKTTIEVGTDTWSGLNQLKGGPGDSFDAVLRRLLALNGVDIEQPEGDEGYVSGEVVLARIERSDGKGTELRPHLIVKENRANEGGDYRVVNMANLKWGSDCTSPTARAYLRSESKTFPINDDKIIKLEDQYKVADE